MADLTRFLVLRPPFWLYNARLEAPQSRSERRRASTGPPDALWSLLTPCGAPCASHGPSHVMDRGHFAGRSPATAPKSWIEVILQNYGPRPFCICYYGSRSFCDSMDRGHFAPGVMDEGHFASDFENRARDRRRAPSRWLTRAKPRRPGKVNEIDRSVKVNDFVSVNGSLRLTKSATSLRLTPEPLRLTPR